MDIHLSSLYKRYTNEWVFKNLSYDFVAKGKYAVLGHNGSGKSTLMRIVSGYEAFSKGQIQYKNSGGELSKEKWFKHISYTAPYLDLIQQYKLQEMVDFHFDFRNIDNQLSKENVLSIVQLDNHKQKLVANLSSGMTQRLKLGLAVLTHSDILLLDEPLSNLDKQAKQWYYQMIEKYLGDRTLIIASNHPDEYPFCDQFLRINDYK